MDTHVKTGQVYLQPRKAGKKWKKVWLSLYPASPNGVGRLEIQDVTGTGSTAGGEWPSPVLGGGARRHHPAHQDRKLRVLRLSEVLSVFKLPPHAEACPKENMAAFCMETEGRTLVLACEREECVDWVEKLCEVAFQKSGSSKPGSVQMEENQIYASRQDLNEFWVVVQQTGAASRCGLQGAYWLQVGQEGLLLKEAEKKNCIQNWPYRLLRRYGRDKSTFSIEAGRRCDSGPGTFTFENKLADRIFSLIEDAINQEKASVMAAGNQEAGEAPVANQLVSLTNRCPRSPLPQIPAVAILENRLKVDCGKSVCSEESVYAQPADAIGSSVYGQPADSLNSSMSQTECVYSQPADRVPLAKSPASISNLPLPLVPTNQTPAVVHPSSQSDPLYADPVDCVRSNAALTKAPVYMDPVCVLPLHPPQAVNPPTIAKATPPPFSSPPAPPQCSLHGNHPEPVYSEVYDNLSAVPDKASPKQSRAKERREKEPVYTEPVRARSGAGAGSGAEPAAAPNNPTQPDPFAHLYAQVCKPAPLTSSMSSQSATSNTFSSSVSSSALPSVVMTTIAKAPAPSDVIYENLGVI